MKKMNYRQKRNTKDLCTLIHRTVQFYTPRSLPLTKEVPPTWTSEVKKTLEEMKINKAPGIDNLTCDVMIAGGEESVIQIKQFLFRS